MDFPVRQKGNFESTRAASDSQTGDFLKIIGEMT
jgi:hypothetical protein